ncbi:MAG TPA: penicillin acylase family protein, partial [Solirubrobacteraceae bacterium]|nr:penicillin acylase family protein [Solirubrobacteraceae bacterium]
MRLTLLLALVACACAAGAAPAQQPAEPFLQPDFLRGIDDAQIHGTITPPGSDTRHARTELDPYDDLVQAYPALTAAQLGDFFKLRLFGDASEGERRYQPRAGVTVVRDGRWGEPAIYGATDADMAFGAGFVAAEDRLPIMELLRALGRAEAFELLGTTPAWLADAEIARVYGYTEEEFAGMIDRLATTYGPTGADVKTILEAYVAGINEYVATAARGEAPLPAGLADLGITSPAPWRTTDVVAVVSIVRALFGAGGGSELTNAAVLAGLARDHGPADGRRIYEDLRNRVNEDGPVHTTRRFPYNVRDEAKLDPAATALDVTTGDDGITGSLEQLASQIGGLAERARVKSERLRLSTPLGAVDLSRPGAMSNHLVVGASRSATGRPILLGGPQAGYFSPQILMDYELHSPTIHARGAGFPGLSTLVVLGRTQDYAWTPTAGGSDMIDTYVERLCSPDGGTVSESSRHYLFRGECVEMDRRTYRTAAQAPAAIRAGLPDIVVERTVHGPVMARGRVGDVAVAVTRKRSTYLKELDPAVSILRMNRNEAKTGDDFVSIFHESHNLSTNWSYANDHEIAYVHGGLYPRRPAAADPDLPVWGTGEWEWGDGFLPSAEVPHEVAPKRDFFVSWNNRPALEWGASDAQWTWSGLHRGDLVEDAITGEPPGSITPTRLVQVMEHAGLTDLRGRYVAPLVLRLLEPDSSAAGGAAPSVSAREAAMLALLRDWIAEGALRRDGDEDGQYDHAAAVAIMDALWERLIRAVFEPSIGDPARIPLQFDNAPGLAGSAYESGFYGQVWAQLSMALGDRLRSPTSRLYCGGTREAAGTRDSCAASVLDALTAAGDALAADQGDDPAAWRADADAERIRFLPGAALSMHWVNRPTTQGLAMFGRRGRNPPAADAACTKRRTFASIAVRARASARPRGLSRLRIRVRPRFSPTVLVDLVRFGTPRRAFAKPFQVLSFGPRRRDFRPLLRRLADGWYAVRFRGAGRDGAPEVRHSVLRRRAGAWYRVRMFERRRPCGPLARFSLTSPVFGGVTRRPLRVRFTLAERARVRVLGRSRTFAPGTHRLRFGARRFRPGVHRIA